LNNSAKTQVHLTEQLINSLSAVGPADESKRQDLTEAAKRSLRMLETLIEQYVILLLNNCSEFKRLTSSYLDRHLAQVKDRERWFTHRYEREVQAKRMWEENMRSVVSSQAELEQQLVDTQKQATRRKKALKELKSSVAAGVASPMSEHPPSVPPTAMAGQGANASTPGEAPSAARLQELDNLVESSDDEDDFYDAVESGTVPVRVETPLQTPDNQEFPKDFEMTDERMMEIESYQGYKKLRDRLPITSDDRPPVSLWAILKGSIGKDLTKISFPVYFNGKSKQLNHKG
jgi:hypothetical protein